jgi:nitronate monooxygenase
MNFGGDGATKVWKDIWGCGQGIGAITSVIGAAELIDRLKHEYEQTRRRLCGQG